MDQIHVYFSGSISGGKGDVDTYRRIVSRLRAAGCRVSAGEVVQKEGGSALSDRKIFQRDVLWLEEVAAKQGILVAEVSTPSHGVGYEIALARHRYRIPVICLFGAGGGRRCSAMIAGDPGIRLIRYDEKSLETALDELVEEVRNAANKTAGGAVLPA